MAYDGTAEAPEAVKADLKGAGLPTPILEKEMKLETTGTVEEIDEDGLRSPSDEELVTLRRIPDKIPWICFTVAFVELCERFAYYGTTTIFVNFIQRKMPVGSTTGNDPHPEGRPGALGRGQRASTGLTTFNRFWAYLMPLVGGYMADAHWGRMKTIQVSIGVAMLGHIVLVISALPSVIKHPNSALGIFTVGLILFGIGVGGFKPNISPLMVEQLKSKKMHVRTEKDGEQVVVDPSLTTQRIFMYFYMFINIGSITGQIAMVYTERYAGFWLAFLLPTILFALCPFVLGVFNKRYVHRPPTGSVLGKSMSLLKYASKGKFSANPAQTYRNFKAPEFWNDVKPSNVHNKPVWMTFDDAWVDEVRRGLKACKVFLWYPLFWLAYNQIDNNLTSQAATMELHGVPNDLLNNLNPLGIVIMIPIIDNFVYPAMRKMKIRFTPLKRITAGFLIGSMAMIWAAVVQSYIYKTGPCGKYMNTCDIPNAPINVWAQSGAYILVGLAEIMASITGLEYAFTKAPSNMRSLVYGFYHATSAISSALGQAFVSLSDDPYLVWLYTSVAILAFIGGIGFWMTWRDLDDQEEELNMLPETTFKGKNKQNESTESIDEERSIPVSKEQQHL